MPIEIKYRIQRKVWEWQVWGNEIMNGSAEIFDV